VGGGTIEGVLRHAVHVGALHVDANIFVLVVGGAQDRTLSKALMNSSFCHLEGAHTHANLVSSVSKPWFNLRFDFVIDRSLTKFGRKILKLSNKMILVKFINLVQFGESEPEYFILSIMAEVFLRPYVRSKN
jgi:hypothetical protein